MKPKGIIATLISVYKQEEKSPEALYNYLHDKKINISWRALMIRWERG